VVQSGEALVYCVKCSRVRVLLSVFEKWAKLLCSLKTIWFPKMDSDRCGHLVNQSRVHCILYLSENKILCIKIQTDGTNV